jgi:hypothetical protein
MSDPTNILGKIGKKVGEELKSFRSTSDSTYATQVSLGNLDERVSINSSSIVNLQQSLVSLGGTSSQAYVTKVSLNNYKKGINVFDDLKATRAEIGDLTVTGTTTTLNTQTVVVEDNIIEVNLKSDGSESAQTGGIQVNRGDGEDKAQVLWNDTNGEFQLVKGSSDASLDVGSVDAEEVLVPSGGKIKINNISLGDFSHFVAGVSLGKA